MDEQNKNLILATGLSFLVIMVWFVLFPPEQPLDDPNASVTAESTQAGDDVSTPTADTTDGSGTATATSAPESQIIDAPRLQIDTPSVEGTLSLQGGRIDQLSLKNYRDTLQEGSDIVQLLKPLGSDEPYYAVFGWAPGNGVSADQVPNANTIWQVEAGEILTPDTSVTLVWENDLGMVFRRLIEIDGDFMFDITQSIENKGPSSASMAPYGILARHGEPEDLKNFFILHEGGIRMVDGELSEIDYDDFEPASDYKKVDIETNGWTGFTDHFWMTTLVSQNDSGSKFTTYYNARNNIYQTDATQRTQTLEPGKTITAQTRLFAGAKEWETIRNYQNEEGVEGFLDSIDWGWFFFLTKPIFWLLHNLNAFIGNMGWSIIALTLIIKAALLPLAFKSYVSMAKMKELQPEMEKLKEAAGDDRQKMQKGMMELYKKEKVNPASGCLPILLQIPIFFSLYKVIFVTLELRHAPWIGWIKDLSAPDPSSFYNLWGVFPWAAPEPGSILALIFIGILPLLLGVSMWLQQKLNPSPTDPTQQMIFAWMPWIFMFMLGSFASGLVVYWIANNTITFSQQYLIMRSQGFKPDVFGNIKSSFKRKPKPTPEDK